MTPVCGKNRVNPASTLGLTILRALHVIVDVDIATVSDRTEPEQ
jgi:hypothetical protein